VRTGRPADLDRRARWSGRHERTLHDEPSDRDTEDRQTDEGDTVRTTGWR
jgi:hypothetical protein